MNLANSRESYQQFLNAWRAEEERKSPEEKKQGPLPPKVQESEKNSNEENLKIEDISNLEEE